MDKVKLNSIGELKPHSAFPDEILTSELTPIPFFDSKKLSFIFDGYEGDENFFLDADEVVSNFLAKDKNYRSQVSSLVFENYVEFVNAVGENEDISKIENKDEIWKFVYPQEIIVSRRHRRDKDIYIQVHCECEWEIEHGLQLVFRQGEKITRVSSIDGHSTEADADDKPDSEDALLSKF